MPYNFSNIVTLSKNKISEVLVLCYDCHKSGEIDFNSV